jgi:hypothetical protein
MRLRIADISTTVARTFRGLRALLSKSGVSLKFPARTSDAIFWSRTMQNR